MITNTLPEAGSIQTDYVRFQGPGEIVPGFRLNINAFDDKLSTATLSVKLGVTTNLPPTPSQKRSINRSIGLRLEGLFKEMARILGEPTSKGRGLLSW